MFSGPGANRVTRCPNKEPMMSSHPYAWRSCGWWRSRPGYRAAADQDEVEPAGGPPGRPNVFGGPRVGDLDRQACQGGAERLLRVVDEQASLGHTLSLPDFERQVPG